MSGNLQIRPLTETRFPNCILWGNNAALDEFDELVVDLEGDVNDLLLRGCAVDLDAAGAADWIEESTLDAEPPFADVFSGISTWPAATASGTASASRQGCPSSPPTWTACPALWALHPMSGATNVSESKAASAAYEGIG